MINSNALRGKIAAAGLTQRELGKLIGVSENTMSAKVNGKSKIWVSEAELLCDILGITDPTEKAQIFFNVPSQNRDVVSARKEEKHL